MMYLVAGNAKTGTSMVANILHSQGIAFGTEFGRWFHHKENLKWVDAINGAGAVEFMRGMKARGPGAGWGVKHPSFSARLPQIVRDANEAEVDFRIIVPFRDGWATRASRQKAVDNSTSHQERLRALVETTREQYELAKSIFSLTQHNQDRIFCFSYEKALVNPIDFAKDLMAFCEIDCDTSEIAKICSYISPERGYVAFEAWEKGESGGLPEVLAGLKP